MEKIHFEIPELKLTIYDRDTTYSSNKHLKSFIYWELVDFVSSVIVIAVVLIVWEFFGIRELILSM